MLAVELLSCSPSGCSVGSPSGTLLSCSPSVGLLSYIRIKMERVRGSGER